MRFRHLTRAGSISCRYLSYDLPNGNPIRLPLLRIHVESETASISTVALIDSGATNTFLPYDIAEEILELPHIEEEVPVTGASATFPCFIAEIKNLTLYKGTEPFAEFQNLHVHVPTPPAEIPYAVLGRDSIFPRYKITFREYDQRFILKRRK